MDAMEAQMLEVTYHFLTGLKATPQEEGHAWQRQI